MRDLSGGLVFRQGIGIVQCVVCQVITRWPTGEEGEPLIEAQERIHLPTTVSSAMVYNLPALNQETNIQSHPHLQHLHVGISVR